jgi:hypothetical protein
MLILDLGCERKRFYNSMRMTQKLLMIVWRLSGRDRQTYASKHLSEWQPGVRDERKPQLSG